VGQQIGNYKIIRELGRGGMGAVYLANRSADSFDQRVALKLLKRGMNSAAIIKRFVMERQILANLDHPNIARMIDGGTTDDGLPYFVLEYIEGTTITRYCDEHKLNTLERLKLFLQVCAAVQFAHQNLIVHRDLKPSNIIVTDTGQPKIIDFGVAKAMTQSLTERTLHTEMGALVGMSSHSPLRHEHEAGAHARVPQPPPRQHALGRVPPARQRHRRHDRKRRPRPPARRVCRACDADVREGRAALPGRPARPPLAAPRGRGGGG
jgi:serine/threonine protein kinase